MSDENLSTTPLKSETSHGNGGKSSSSLLNKVGFSILALLVIIPLGFALFSKPDGPETVEEAELQAAALGEKINDLEFITEDGTTSTLRSYQGKPLVVNFFASTCAPCRAELPEFEEVHQEVKDEITFIGVNHDFQEATWKAFVAETNISFETVFQPNQSLFKELQGAGLPATVFISGDGDVQEFFAGVLDKKSLETYIDEFLTEET